MGWGHDMKLPIEAQQYTAGSSVEFRSSKEIEEMKKLEKKIHLGHQHLELPFDFQHVQISVWFGLIPATYLLLRNVQLLKLDTIEEYDYLKM